MDQDPFKNKPIEPKKPDAPNQGKQEQLEVKIEMAKPEDWQDIKKLRLKAISGKYGEMFGATPESIEKEMAKTDAEWKEGLLSDNGFICWLGVTEKQ